MRSLWRWLFAATAALLLSALLAAALALQDTPRVPRRVDISPADVERALMIVRSHDPRRALPGQQRVLLLGEHDVDLLVHHLANHWLAITTRVTLERGVARIRASVELPGLPLRRWLNVELQLRQTGALPEVQSLRVGRLPLPGALAEPGLRWLAARHGLDTEAAGVFDVVRRVQIGRGSLFVVYALGADTRERLLAAALPPADRERLRQYGRQLALATEPAPASGAVSLAQLLPPLFRLAAERSAAGADALQENRAAILALAMYANRDALEALLPALVETLPARALRVTLQQRDDFPRHFLISAAVAAEAGSPLADAVGLWKELDDARRGSGFSFNDIAADRAGTRLGELAVQAPARLQARLAAGATEADFMPAVADLPEYLPEATFTARFGGVGAPAYRRMMAEVEARVGALPLFR